MRKAIPWCVLAFSLAAAAIFCIVFFCLLWVNLPETVPVHITNGVGVDRYGSKSELIPLGIIPIIFATLMTIPSVWSIKKEMSLISYIISGFSVFLTAIMILAVSVLIPYI